MFQPETDATRRMWMWMWLWMWIRVQWLTWVPYIACGSGRRGGGLAGRAPVLCGLCVRVCMWAWAWAWQLHLSLVVACHRAELLLFLIFCTCWKKCEKLKILYYMRAFMYIQNSLVFIFFFCIFYRCCFYAYFPQHIWSRAAALKSSKRGVRTRKAGRGWVGQQQACLLLVRRWSWA